jgi:hypothetical protein
MEVEFVVVVKICTAIKMPSNETGRKKVVTGKQEERSIQEEKNGFVPLGGRNMDA